MSFSARYLAIFIALFGLAVSVCAQSTATQTTKTARGSISGRIMIKDKGVAGVAIGLRKGDGGFPFEPFQKTTTDADGYYRINNLASGTYEVTPSAPAYVIGANNNENSKAVIVGEDENVEGINFSLVRGGVITGKVTDADGRPLILQQVYLFRTEVFQQTGPVPRPPLATTATVTDDRGIYRMYGLAAGSYKVASGRSEDTFSSPGALSRSSYKRVFHPDATEDSRATTIVVTEGSEANNVDIAMGRPQQTFSASGKVIDGEKGMPIPNLRFGLQRAAGPRFVMVPAQIMSNSKGDFLIEGLTPGKYGVYMFQSLTQNQYPDMRAESITFEIIDQDVTNLTVRLTKGASLSGIVVLDTEDKAAIQKFRELQLRAFVIPPQGIAGYGQSSSSPIGPDGSFRLGGLSEGVVNISIGSPMGPMVKGFMISRIERDGIAAPPRGLEVKEGEQVTGLRLTVSYGTASIRGVIKFENGSLSPESVFIRLTKPGESFSNLPFARVDARGHFLIEAVPAGVYEVQAMVQGGQPGRRVKQEVTVQDGMVSEVVLTIDLGTTPK